MEKLEPFQVRMLDELKDLNNKIYKLKIFIKEDNPIFFNLDDEEKIDLRYQLEAMEMYYSRLFSRCKRQNLI